MIIYFMCLVLGVGFGADHNPAQVPVNRPLIMDNCGCSGYDRVYLGVLGIGRVMA